MKYVETKEDKLDLVLILIGAISLGLYLHSADVFVATFTLCTALKPRRPE